MPGAAGVFSILDGVDDGDAAVNLGSNSFNFFGTTYTGASTLFASTSGLITFGTGYSNIFNSDLTSSPSPATIAPMWQYWTTIADANDMVLGKFQDTTGDGVADRLIIEWSQVRLGWYGTGASDVTFQAILQLNTGATPGAITFNYPDLDTGDGFYTEGNFSTVGVKDAGPQGDERLLISYNDTSIPKPLVGSGKAIRIEPTAFWQYAASAAAFESLDLVPRAPGVFSVVDNVDDDTAAIDLGSNTFNLYGTTYTGASSLFASSNGLLSFGSDVGYSGNTDLTFAPGQATIAPLWDDWRTDLDLNDQVLAKLEDTTGDGVADRLIVEWSRVQHYATSPSDVTFQAILQLNTGATPGDITLNYPDLDTGDAFRNGSGATVGIKNAGSQGDERLLVSYNDGANPLVGSGKAIRIAVAPPATGLQREGSSRRQWATAFSIARSAPPGPSPAIPASRATTAALPRATRRPPKAHRSPSSRPPGRSASSSAAGPPAPTRCRSRPPSGGNYQASRQDFNVLVDGVVVGTFTPAGTSYQPYTTAVFTVTAGAHTIKFQGLDTAGGDNTAFIDDRHRTGHRPDRRRGVRAGGGGCRPVPVPPHRLTLDLRRQRGHLRQQQRLHLGQPAGPRGRQVAFLQTTGSFSQSVSGWAAGSYTLTFKAAQRGNHQASRQDFNVLVDGVVVGTFTPSGTSYQATPPPRSPSRPGRTRSSSRDWIRAGGDNTAFVDQIAVAQAQQLHDRRRGVRAGGRWVPASSSTAPPAHPGPSPAVRASPATTAASPRATRRPPRAYRSPSCRRPARSASRSAAGPPAPTRSPSRPPSAATTRRPGRTSTSWLTGWWWAPSRPLVPRTSPTPPRRSRSRPGRTRSSSRDWIRPAATTPPSLIRSAIS